MNKQTYTYRSVLFIDAGVANAAALAAGVADDVLVVKLVAWRDGVEQIATVLRQHQGLDSVQIVSHGAEGQLQLGKTVLSAANLGDYSAALTEWGAALRDSGDLLLYGCDVSAGDAGLAFIDHLALATSADVGASTDTTGSTLLGANWALEASTGSIEAASVLNAQALQAYDGTLALANNGVNGTISFGTSSNVTVLSATGLAPGAVVNATNILGTGFDLYTQSSGGGAITVLNANGDVLGLTDDRLTINGSLLSPASYVDLRANAGVFDLVSIKIGSGNLVGNLLGNVIYTVYALDANYQPTGVGVSVVGLLVNEYGLLNFASMANFKSIYGFRITNPLGFEIGIDDIQVANAHLAPSITSSSYNAATGVLTISATGINAGDAIDPAKLTLTGQGGSYTLTSSVVGAASASQVVITLNAADKLALNGLLNNNGGAAVDGTTFNIAAAANWDGNVTGGPDATGNPVTVSNVQLPTITAASYNAATNVLTVTGSNLVGVVGALNDITVSKLTLRGEGGATRVLSTSGNVEVTSATSFTVTLSGADVAAVTALMTKNGTSAANGTAYQLSAGDDWNSVIGNANIAVAGVSVVVTNTSNTAPTISGAAAGAVADNATLQPFSGVTVADVNGDNVSMTISYNGANGTLSGAGLSGSAGSYTLAATTPAALTAQLKALVFTPTANQAAVGVGVATTFSLTATDSLGLAGAVNTSTVVTATSVNDAPVFAGTAAAQGVTAGGTVRPFSAVTVADADVGATVIVTIKPDSATKGVFTPASLSASGFTTTDGGATYTHAAAAPAAAQAALQALVFQSTAGLNATTTFTVTLNDGSVIVSNNATTVVAAAPSSTTALTVAFSADSGTSNADLVTNVAAQTISGTLSAALVAGESVQVSLDNGTSWTTASAGVGATTWQLAGQFLANGVGTLQVRVNNIGGYSTPLSVGYELDTSAPTTTGASAVFSADSGIGGDRITNIAAQDISGTLSANLAAGERVEVSLNNGSTWIAASITGANSWQLAGQTISGSNTLQVRVVDAAGNAGTGAGFAYAYDSSAPSATLTSNVGTLKSGESALITITFSEPPVGLVLGDLVPTNGSLANLVATANPRVYTVEFTPAGGLIGGAGGVALTAGSYTDAAGNAGGGASSSQISITTVGPSVAITSDAATLKAGQTALITFTFSSLPQGFSETDVVVSGGTLSVPAYAGGNVYTATFTPGANVTAPASITVTGGSYTDLLGNQGGAGASPVIAIDTRPPTLIITSNLTAVHIGDSATITFTFSEAPVGFTAGDVVVSGGTLGALGPTANPLVYTASFTPDANVASGAASITVAASTYTDAAGNDGQAGTSPSISIDTLAPTTTTTGVTFSNDTGDSGSDLVTRTAAQTISGTLSSALAVGEVVQVSLDHGQTWFNASAAAGATSWSLAGRTLVASDILQVRVNDAVGNHGPVFSHAYTLDTTAPTVSVSSSATALSAGQSATLTFTFSEAPYNFTATSLAVTGGTISNLAAGANPLVYTAVFTPAAGQSGVNASVAVNAGGYADLAGNGGAASAPVSIAVNSALPTLVITSNTAALKGGETALISFTFSQPPTGFTVADISTANGSVSGFTATSNPLIYTALFTPTAGLASGSAGITVAANSYTDAFGNSGGAGTSPLIAIDTLAPTVAITSSVAAVKGGETALISFTFSEAPLGFTAGDVETTGGTLGSFTATANPLVYTAVFTPAAGIQGVAASISIAGNTYTDAAGNANPASGPSPTLNIDTLAPSAVAASVALLVDSGIPGDLVTNTAAQTISGILGSALGAGEFVEVSLDNGVNWASATAGAGNSWSLAGATLLAGSNTLQVRVTDAAGNHGNAYTRAYVLDNTAPSVAVSSSAVALKAGETATISFTFSEAPNGFTDTDLVVTGGTLGPLTATANPLVYTALLTPAAGVNGGSASVSVTAASYTDAAGNPGAGVTLAALPVDTQAPTTSGASVVFSADSGTSGDLLTNVAAQDLSGTLSAYLVAGETVQVSLNNGVTWLAASASVGANGWTLAGQTLATGPGHQVQVRVSDAAGNHGTAYSAAYTLDQSAPTLQISSDRALLNSAETATISFTFSEAPAAFNAGAISVGGGTLGPLTATANPLVYTAVFTPTAGQVAGSGAITVAAGTYTDLAGNAGVAAAVAPIAYSTATPGVAVSSDLGALKAGQTAVITFKLSAPSNDFVVGDVTVNGGTLSGFGPTGDPLVYTATFIPTAGLAAGSGTVVVNAGSFSSGGNLNAAGSMTPISIDTLAPTLAISSNAASLNSSGTALITFTFSEAPAAFSLGDVSVGNGSLSNLVQSANPLVYTALLTPAANVASGNVSIAVAPGAYADLAGNAGNAASGPSITIDTLAPSLVASTVQFLVDSGSAGDLITNVSAQTIFGALSGTPAAGDVVEVSLNNGVSWSTAVITGNNWSLANQSLSGAGTLQVRLSDANGNHGAAVSRAYVFDNTAPTVAISSDSATLRAGQSATISFSFSEAPIGFAVGDLIASGGSLSGFSATANPLVYTVVLTPTPGYNGSASVTLGAGLYNDAAGNLGGGGSSPSISVDALAPTLAIAANATALKAGESATVTFTFSEAPVGFTLADINATFGSVSGLTATANPLVYRATFTPDAGTNGANAVISVANGLYTDAAGNPGAGAGSTAIAVDTQAPTTVNSTVSFSADFGASSTDLVVNGIGQVVSGVLATPLAAGEIVMVSLDNGAHWLAATAVSATVWLLPPQLLAGSNTLQVRVADAVGNLGPLFSAGYVLDLVAPTMVVTSSASTLKTGESATLTFTFSEVPANFTSASVVAFNGTLSGFAVDPGNPLIYKVTLTPAAGLAGATAGVSVAAGQYTDVAGNAGATVASPLITVDTAAPTLQITSSGTNLKIGELATITFTFSELPVGFTVGDISVAGGVLSGFGLTANPLVYTAVFTPTVGLANGSGTIEVLGGSYHDAAGNAGVAALMTPIAFSTLAPGTSGTGVSFDDDRGASPTDLVTNIGLQVVKGTLDAPLAAGELVEVSFNNGVLWVPAAADGPAGWTLGLQALAGSGTLQVRVTDAAGNHGAVSTSAYSIDTVAPLVTIGASSTVLKAGDTTTLSFTFSEVPYDFQAGDLVVTGGSIGALVVSAGDPRVYTTVFTPTPGYSGAAGVTVPAGSYMDLAGNLGLGSGGFVLSVDAQAPTVAITSSAATLKGGETALITFTFSEVPVGFAAGDASASGGALSGFTATANPLVYTAVFTPTAGTAAGSAVVSVANNVYGDAAGNSGVGASSTPISIDTLAPLAAAIGTPTFSSDTGVSATDLITTVAAQTVSGTLSAPLAGGDAVQVSFNDGVSWQSATVSGTSWSLGHTLTGSGVLRVRVVDAAGNHSVETATPYAYDQIPPTVVISADRPVANGVSPTVISFTFSEAPVGFSAANITVSGGVLGALTATANPLVYTALFTPVTGVASGSASITLSGGYIDAAGNNGGAGSIAALQIDTVAPTTSAGGASFLHDSGSAPDDLITNDPSQTVSGTLSAPLLAGEVVQVSFDGVVWHTAAVSGTAWELAGQTLAGAGTLSVRVADAAGNFNAAYSVPYHVDTVAPTVTVSSNLATLGIGQSAILTFTLSDPGVLTAADIALTGGAVLSNFSGSGTTYTATVMPPANSVRPISVSVAGQLFSDTAGNASLASTPLVLSVNTNPPPDNPGTPSSIDGVQVNTTTGTDARTGLVTRTVSVPTITSSRAEDNSTEHANLADIPIGIAANGGNPGSTLVVSVPVGVGFEASGPSSLLSGAMALTDLISRIGDHTAAGQANRAAMEAQARQFLASMDSGDQLQHATLKLSGVNGIANTAVLVDGSDMVASGGASGGNTQHDTVPGDDTAVALVIDVRSLPLGIGLQLDDVQFAAIIGAANVQGGAGQNFFIGDGEAQRIVLTTGNDNDTLYGNGGDDILGTASGNDYLDGGDGRDWLAGGGGNDRLVGGAADDVLQGGRSDVGQWQFFLKDGKVVGQHQLALAGATNMETVTAAELNGSQPLLAFAGASTARLETLSLLYHAAFERAPDLLGLNFWAGQNSLSAQQLAAGFLMAPEAVQGLTKLSNHDYVATLLENALGVKPAESALTALVARLDAAAPGDLTARAGVLADIALTSEHRAAWTSSSDGMALGGQLLAQEQGWLANSGDDRLEGGAGSDRLVGGDGIDTVVYSGAAAGYALALSANGEVMIREPDGALDTILQIERGEFNGVTLDLGFTQAATATLQEIGMLYHLTLGRAGDFPGFQFWLDSGLSGSALASGFMAAPEFQQYASLGDSEFVTMLYQHTLAQAPSAAVLAQWDSYLDSHSRADLVAQLAGDVTLVGSQYGAGGLSLIGSL